MVNELSIVNDNDENKSLNKDADEDGSMMEVDGQADIVSAEYSPSHDRSDEEDDEDDDEEEEDDNIEKLRVYDFEEADTADTAVDVETIDTVIVFDTIAAIHIDDLPEITDNTELSLSTRFIEKYLYDKDFEAIFHISPEQLLTHWLTSSDSLPDDDDE